MYSSKEVPLKEPEFYVVYTGNQKIPENHTISLKKDFHFIENDMVVHVIQDYDLGTFFGQYQYFCKSLEVNRNLYGDNVLAITHTIDECIDHNVFKEYMEMNRSEVVDMIDILFDQERVLRQTIEEAVEEEVEKVKETALAEGRAQGITEGRAQGIVEGRAQGITEGRAQGITEGRAEGLAEGESKAKKDIAIRLKRNGMKIDLIVSITNLTKEEIENL